MQAPGARPNAATKGPQTWMPTEIPVLELSDSEDDIAGPLRPLKSALQNVFAGSLDNIVPLTGIKTTAARQNNGDENAPPQTSNSSQMIIGSASAVDKPAADLAPDPLAQVLEVVPDVQAAYAQGLIEQHKTVEAVLNALFENPAYPKIEKKKGKRKAEEPIGLERGAPKAKVDYMSTERPVIDGNYFDLALEQLQVDFPLIPKAHIRNTLYSLRTFYAPTYFHLRNETRLPHRPYRTKTIPYRSKGKSQARESVAFTQELEWLRQKLQEEQAGIAQPSPSATPVPPPDEDMGEEGIECGCCFTSYAFEKMVQCPDAHLFCTECMVSYAENLLGAHNPNIICMDQSGCKLPFPESELRRFLDEKLLALYERVKQRKEIEAAGLEGLEECPFCEYKVVIENPDEKLFRCEREECGAVSCRACKKLDHLPKTCKEVDEDRILGGQHAVEEAMTQALLRNCPKCQKVFIKESGCNKMTCPNCATLSCYVCRQIITGYDHFNQNPNAPQAASSSSSRKKCLLWEEVERRHADDVKAAAERAMEELKRDNPEVDATAIKVDVPKAPPPRTNAPGLPAYAAIPVPAALPPPAAVANHQARFQQNMVRLQEERERIHMQVGMLVRMDAERAAAAAAVDPYNRLMAAARDIPLPPPQIPRAQAPGQGVAYFNHAPGVLHGAPLPLPYVPVALPPVRRPGRRRRR